MNILAEVHWTKPHTKYLKCRDCGLGEKILTTYLSARTYLVPDKKIVKDFPNNGPRGWVCFELTEVIYVHQTSKKYMEFTEVEKKIFPKFHTSHI